MKVTKELFGRTSQGTDVHRVKLTGGGLTAHVMSWGAALQDLRMDGFQAPLVLGSAEFDPYLAHSPYFGATPGRYANRIAGGRFELDGATYQLDRNEKGKHHLHGGSDGFASQVWQIADLGTDFVRFELDDPDGHMGYPGRCRAACTYRLKPDGVLSLVHEAETDKPTLCNMAHHSYFNLDGDEDILYHDIFVAADHYLPVDAELIPTGEVRPVRGTDFEFSEMRPMVAQSPMGYDHNFCLSDRRVEKRPVALVRSPRSGVTMDVWTGEPGLQFYTGGSIAVPVPGLMGQPYGAHAGFCLESQVWPDSPNHSHFPSAVLRPGETLVQETDYVFSRT